MKKLVVVQHKPTQFDVPFYTFATRANKFDLHVYYTYWHDAYAEGLDPEIGIAPIWDNLDPESYSKTYLSAGEIADPRRICKKIAGHWPDLVLLCGYTPLLHSRLAWLLKKNKVRIGLRSDNTLRHSSFRGLKGLAKRLVLPFWLRQYDTWHPVGTLAAEYLKKIAKTEKPVCYFPYSVDNAWFARQAAVYKQNQTELKSQIGFSENDFIVLGVMKWHRREDPLTLVEAVGKINKEKNRVKLILVGDGPLRSEVRQAAERIKDSVHFPGYLPYSELPKFYAISDVFVHPAVGEQWGVSVNEAMACGVPVIAAESVGSARDLISKGKTGDTFPAGDIDRLAESLLELYRSPKVAAAMGNAARKQVDKWSYGFSVNEMTKALDC
jgi:glycosyltransferase involved in cell wall biosynthesis